MDDAASAELPARSPLDGHLSVTAISDATPPRTKHWQARKRESRQLDPDWLLIPITDDDLKPGRHTHYVSSACKCMREISFTLPGILAREGKKSTVKPPRPVR